MQRRAFIAGVLLLGGGLAVQHMSKGVSGSVVQPSDTKSFAAVTSGVKLQYLPPELLAKITAGQVSDQDRGLLASALVSHNRDLFVVEAYERQHGAPGFYRVIE